MVSLLACSLHSYFTKHLKISETKKTSHRNTNNPTVLKWQGINWYTPCVNVPDVVWVLGLQVPHQRTHWGFELGSSCRWSLQVDFGWVAFRKQLFDEALRGLVHGLRQVPIQQVVVLVYEALHAIQHLYTNRRQKWKIVKTFSLCALFLTHLTTRVQHLAGVVLDTEAAVRQAVVGEELWILAEAALKVLVLGADGVQFVQEGLVGDRPRPQALLVQHGQDAILVLDIKRQVKNGRLPSSARFSKLKFIIIVCLCGFQNAFEVMLHHTKLVCGGETGRVTHILNEVADNGVVEIFNVGPLDALWQKKWRSKGQ